MLAAIFRVDASTQIGSGHIFRCITLARLLSAVGWTCKFACGDESLETVPVLIESGFDIIGIPTDKQNDPSILVTAFPHGVALLVVDHYELDRTFEEACRPWAQNIVVIDDLANRYHDADVLLDQTYGRKTEDYESRVSKSCRIFVGSQYALLRPEFARARQEVLSRRDGSAFCGIDKILISFGSTDPNNATALAVRGIRQWDSNVSIDVVLSSKAIHLETIKNQLKSLPNTNLFIDQKDMVRLMSRADLAIGAGGITTWERCCLGLPSLSITLAENQLLTNYNLDRVGAIKHLGKLRNVTPSQIASSAFELSKNSEKLETMSLVSRQLCDGRGYLRFLVQLAGARFTRQGDYIDLRLVEQDDEETLFSWQNIPKIRHYFRDPKPPTYNAHRTWFTDHFENAGMLASIIQCNGQPVGLLQLTSTSQDQVEISILLDPNHWGQGIGITALSLARNIYPGFSYRAEILPQNIQSLKLFQRSGFIQTENTDWYKAPAKGDSWRLSYNLN